MHNPMEQQHVHGGETVSSQTASSQVFGEMHRDCLFVAATTVSTTADVQMKELGDGEIMTAMDQLLAVYPDVDRLQHPGLGPCHQPVLAQIQGSALTVLPGTQHSYYVIS